MGFNSAMYKDGLPQSFFYNFFIIFLFSYFYNTGIALIVGNRAASTSIAVGLNCVSECGRFCH